MLRPVLFGCFLGSILNLCQCISFANTFANTWAVKIHGGDAVLKRLARKHGFVNESKVGELCVNLTLECTEPLFACEKTLNVKYFPLITERPNS